MPLSSFTLLPQRGACLAALTLGLLAAPAADATDAAAATSAPAASAAAAADPAVLAAFGGPDGFQALALEFVNRTKADARIGHYFKNIKTPALAESLGQQFCAVLGGPCVYEGATMKASHKGLGIGRSDYNRLVERLQDAMDARGIPFAAQNRLLAVLAPMYRDIEER